MKSWSIAEGLIRLAARRCIRVLCVREHQVSIKDSSHKTLKDTIARLNLGAFFTVTKEGIYSRTGSEFIFKGLYGNEEGIKSTEGIDFCWVEEAQTVNASSWKTLAPTIRKSGSEIWVSYNLINEEDATHARFVGEPDAEFPNGRPKRTNSIVHKVNYDLNPWFKESELYQEMLDDKAESQHLYEHIWLGMPLVMDESIVMSGKYVVEAFDDLLWLQAPRLHFGLDFGFANDPSAGLRMFMLEEHDGLTTSGMPRVHTDLYISHEVYQHRVEIDAYDEFLADLPNSKEWPIKADCARPEVISHIARNFGYNISGAEKWDGSVKDGIAFLRGMRKIRIHPRCVNTAREARLYSYKVDKNTKEVLPAVIVGKHDHTWDAGRYGLDGYIQRSGALGIWHRIGKPS